MIRRDCTQPQRLQWAACALLVAFCVHSLGCGPPAAVLAPDRGCLPLEAEAGEARLRLYGPEADLELAWPGGRRGRPLRLVLENVAAGAATVELVPLEGRPIRPGPPRPISPTSLAIDIPAGTGRHRIEIRPADGEADRSPLTFAVCGDSQGRNDVLASVIEAANDAGVEFLVHLGDMVPSGREEEYRAFLGTLASLNCPCYTVPGNHDVRRGGDRLYGRLLAPSVHRFDYRGHRFIFLDSSSLGLDQEQLTYLRESLATPDPAFIFLHVPPLDPRGKDHGFASREDAREFIDLVLRSDSPVAVFSGHVHMFHQHREDGVAFVTSGGAGAPPYAPPEAGGYYHLAVVEHGPDGLTVTPVPVPAPEWSDAVVVSGPRGEEILSLEELSRLPLVAAESCYQNRLGNFRGRGIYRGVPVRHLLNLVGGMQPGDTLSVQAADGYSQQFTYANVYPETADWLETQGEMILGLEFAGRGPPDWAEGYRLAFLPPDGVYDNSDCARTSAPGQGWNVYESAGARWLKTVVRLEVSD